jgi:hypothetical protein
MAPRRLRGQHVHLVRPNGPVLLTLPFLGRCVQRPHVGTVRGPSVHPIDGDGLEQRGRVVVLDAGQFGGCGPDALLTMDQTWHGS